MRTTNAQTNLRIGAYSTHEVLDGGEGVLYSRIIKKKHCSLIY